MKMRAPADPLSCLVLTSYLASLALLPWSWFPRFPWLHAHAQWSDAVFAATAVLWFLKAAIHKNYPPIGSAAILPMAYAAWATASALFVDSNRHASLIKCVGIWELVCLSIITADLVARPEYRRLIALAIAWTSLVSFAAAALGLVLFYGGLETRLIGTYGDLEPSRWYARAEAGAYHPALLGNFSIFSAAVLWNEGKRLSPVFRRVVAGALTFMVIATVSRALMGFILAWLIQGAQTPRRKAAAALFGVMGTLILVLLTVFNVRLDISRPLSAVLEDAPSPRAETLRTVIPTILRRPWFGVGPANSPATYRGIPFDAHCTPLNVAGTLGFPALVLAAGFVFSVWRRRAAPGNLPLWAGLAGIGLDSLALDVEDFRHVWVLLGLVQVRDEASFVDQENNSPDGGTGT